MDRARDRRHNSHRRSRSRSRSPYRRSEEGRKRRHHHRRSDDGREGRKSHKQHDTPPRPRKLPYNARELVKGDFETFRPMFTLYLDIQKSIDLDTLETAEGKGRWKSFVNKCIKLIVYNTIPVTAAAYKPIVPLDCKNRTDVSRNRGELAEGWYDPATLQKAIDTLKASPPPSSPPGRRGSPKYADSRPQTNQDSSEDEYGPLQAASHHHAKSGPSIPTMQDLRLRRELDAEDELNTRETLQDEQRAHRKEQKERLDELAPRAEAGTRERQLEKHKELAASNRAFAAAKEGGVMVELNESDLMGGDDAISDLKRQKQETERKKNEREIRKEEIMRAKREEREERAREFREREERTMAGLKELARQRFG